MKERLVGAAVLMAAAVILVPEMLSGPPEGKRAETPQATGETPVKTFTIDFSKAQQSGADVPDTRAPPGEFPAPPVAAQSEADAENAELPSQAVPESERIESDTRVASASPTQPKAPTTVPEAKTPATTSVKPPAPAATASNSVPSQPQPSARSAANEPTSRTQVATRGSDPTSKGSGWAVQLGSFSSRATADRLAGEMKGAGYDAFVMPIKSGNATLYRVRIGPAPSREQAEATLRKVKGKVPGAAIVSHP